jgi:hypothetical protein
MMDTCLCGNPRCPKSYGCDHCMCLSEPDFGPNRAIQYAGPLYSVCCKCGYRYQVGGIKLDASMNVTCP